MRERLELLGEVGEVVELADRFGQAVRVRGIEREARGRLRALRRRDRAAAAAREPLHRRRGRDLMQRERRRLARRLPEERLAAGRREASLGEQLLLLLLLLVALRQRRDAVQAARGSAHRRERAARVASRHVLETGARVIVEHEASGSRRAARVLNVAERCSRLGLVERCQRGASGVRAGRGRVQRRRAQRGGPKRLLLLLERGGGARRVRRAVVDALQTERIQTRLRLRLLRVCHVRVGRVGRRRVSRQLFACRCG